MKMIQAKSPTEIACEPAEGAHQPVQNILPPVPNTERKRMNISFADDEKPDSQTARNHMFSEMKILQIGTVSGSTQYLRRKGVTNWIQHLDTQNIIQLKHHDTQNILNNIDVKYDSTYKEALSQPPYCISHRERLLWLQKRRVQGLYVQCDECSRWRYLDNVIDRHELPKKWYCRMNPDKKSASCSVPEVPISIYDEEDLIYSEYSAGSLVVARLDGWPWWPAMVDDCPDTEQYYWLDGFSDIPTHYNVVFFDSCEVTRAWVAPSQIKPYKEGKNLIKTSVMNKKSRKRMEAALKQANDAEKLTQSERLNKYSFIARYTGKIVTPKKVDPKEIRKHQAIFKRRYSIAFSPEASDTEEENQPITETPKKRNDNTQGKTKRLDKDNKVGEGKTKLMDKTNEVEEGKTKQSEKVKEVGGVQTKQLDKGNDVGEGEPKQLEKSNLVGESKTKSDKGKEFYNDTNTDNASLAVQVDTNSDLANTTNMTNINDTPTTDVADSSVACTDIIEETLATLDWGRSANGSPGSGDFDF